MRGRIATTLCRLRVSESGIALPLTLLIMVVGLALVSVPVLASVNSQNADSRNQASNEALAAAEAGAELGILRQTQSGLTKECVTGTASGGWCPEVAGTIGAASYVYRVKPVFSTSGGNDVVTVYSVGTAEVGGAKVRRQVSLEGTSTPGASSSTRVLGAEGIVGEETVNLGGGGNTSYGNVGTNGQLTYSNESGTNLVCGNIRIGEGQPAPGVKGLHVGTDPNVPVSERPYRESNHNGICYPPEPASNHLYQGTVHYPLPEPPADLKTNNSDGRFFSEDGRDLPSWYLQNPTNAWNPETKTLSIDNSVTLTLSGTKPYLLCRLRLEGATIKTQAPNQPVQIWFEKPENCPNLPTVTNALTGTSDKQQLIIANGAHFTNNGYYPGLYFLGSSSVRTQAKVEAQDVSGLFYGPLTDFESTKGGIHLSGAIVARTVDILGGGQIKSTFNGETYEIPAKGGSSAPTSFSKSRFTECTATTVFGSGC